MNNQNRNDKLCISGFLETTMKEELEMGCLSFLWSVDFSLMYSESSRLLQGTRERILDKEEKERILRE